MRPDGYVVYAAIIILIFIQFSVFGIPALQ
jgi:hypothetical protein